MKDIIHRLLGFLVVALMSMGGIGNAWGGSPQTVVALYTNTLTSTKRTLSGARTAIKSYRDSVIFYQILLKPNDDNLAAQIDSVKAYEPDIILSIGSAATQLAKDNFGATPTVFASVMYPVVSGFVKSLNRPGENMTGASLDIRPDIQFKYFRQIIPDLKTLGVLYTGNTASLIPPARVLANQMGLKLIAIKVNGPKDLPRALDSLTRTVDGLWSLADPNLFDPQSTKYILLNSLRRGIPFMGFSRYVVESGALFALDFDYKAIGRQAGHITTRILAGEDPGRIKVSPPDFIWFHCNEKTAAHLKITFPPELMAIAKEVYR